jgi:D-amino-acid dehydrogenase
MFTPLGPIHLRPRLRLKLLRWGLDFLRSATNERAQAARLPLRDLALLSRRCYQQLAGEQQDRFALRQHGLYVLCRDEATLHEEAELAHEAQALGLGAEVLDMATLQAREPGFAMRAAGAICHTMDAHLTPQALVEGLRMDLAAAGVEFLWGHAARQWQTTRGRVTGLLVAGPQGQRQLGADDFVLAAGSWTPETTRGLQLRLPIEAGKGYSLTLPTPPALPQACFILAEARIAVTPMGNSLRIGGTMEFSGLDESVDQARVQALIGNVQQFLPQFPPDVFAGVQPWTGLRPIAPDGLPYIGRTRRWQNLVVASGHAMMGLSLAAGTGQLVGEVLDGREPSMPLAPFAPERFG